MRITKTLTALSCRCQQSDSTMTQLSFYTIVYYGNTFFTGMTAIQLCNILSVVFSVIIIVGDGTMQAVLVLV